MNDRSWIEINLDNYIFNLEAIKKFILPHQSIMQIVKADAYGHGAAKIATTGLEHGVKLLGVANADEGCLLRYMSKLSENTTNTNDLSLLNCPIIILSPSLPHEIDLIIENNLIPSVTELDFCLKLDKEAKIRGIKYPVHLKIDTGMNRNGIRYDMVKNFLEDFKKFTSLELEGVFSHYLESEEDNGMSEKQIIKFEQVLSLFDKIKYIHIANSAGVLFRNYEKANIVRLGFLSYGVNSNSRVEKTIRLKPVMSFKSKIAHISMARKGETIGYNSSFVAESDIQYAIIPVGYADGYDFLLSNKAKVLINNHLCPVIGRVSMDMLCADITGLEDVSLFGEVTVLGHEQREINAAHLASLYNGSAYELLTQIGRRAKRYYKINNQIIDQEPVQKRSFIPSDFNSKKLSNIIKNAIAHRMQNNEVATVIYDDILRYFFIDSDKEISYRSNFKHDIVFSSHPAYHNYFKVKTTLQFQKVLQNDFFNVACAVDSEVLKYFFRLKSCEYRWIVELPSDESLFENGFNLLDYFKLSKVRVNDIDLSIVYDSYPLNCKPDKGILFTMTHPILKEFNGEVVTYFIETETIYPKNSHQLTVYINEITKGAEVSFTYPDELINVEMTSIFAGRERFPECIKKANSIKVKTKSDMWIFPNSGIVFSY